MNHREPDHKPQSATEADADAALMAAFAQGDEEAFVTLYRRYRDRMVNFARRLLGDQALAEEAAQDVFLKLYRARDRYRPSSRFSTFIYRIATNHCLNIKARHEHKLTDRSAVAEDLATSSAQQALDVERHELQRALRAALAKLPQKQRAALLLCHYEGMSYAEAAQVVEVSESAIKSLIHRARDRMSKELAGLMETPELDHAV